MDVVISGNDKNKYMLKNDFFFLLYSFIKCVEMELKIYVNIKFNKYIWIVNYINKKWIYIYIQRTYARTHTHTPAVPDLFQSDSDDDYLYEEIPIEEFEDDKSDTEDENLEKTVRNITERKFFEGVFLFFFFLIF